ncbi:RNA-directed RNA polymerase [ssRNA phage SRR7976299_17]|uniref:RNA-directed RNA polymerase n=1 Tax=ssRNA phage SRR7976299_17 TaxID=2786639 RepID=A0A8S5L4M7_9VIRU|nr:RNA-directed RNA polymerase [ssRNA phage SRR7976299_17]DAD52648.1 TPA_asm: RNA-directed RNA polymerase [ssRNA phage SRR7976299_17]
MKSHASNLVELLICVLTDAVRKCDAQQPDSRDVATLRARVKHEGMSFLTITLPTLSKDLEKGLAMGVIDSTCFRSFRKRGTIPAFLQGMFSLVFDVGTGRLLDEPNISAIEGIRQFSNAFKKLEIPCSPSRVGKALTEFKSVEQGFSVAINQDDIDYFINVSRAIWPRVLGVNSVDFSTLSPKHGPGATAEKLSGNQKFNQPRWHDRLEPYFPVLHWAFSNENALESPEFGAMVVVGKDEEQPVRVVPVPKTLKTPRIIAIEPVCMQYTQQALSEYVVRRIESSGLTSGHVNFTDQTINQKLAMSSSVDESLATLDLSSASDRVPHSLAIRMFDHDPCLQGAVDACRSLRAQMPSGEEITLKKFASMGSALCFPVEAMYFYTICIAALLRKHNLPVTFKAICRVAKNVYVYGDDILVPTDCAPVVIDHLHKYYCKVNTNKSFWTGKFRESCGVDAYNGEPVKPVYVHALRPDNKRETRSLISWVETSNLFYKKGYWRTAAHMINVCESYLGSLPIVGPECSGLGKVSFQHLISVERWSKKYHCFEVKAWCAVPVYHNDELEGYPALTKCLLSMERRKNSEPTLEKDHLVKTARHGAVALKRRWVRPH